MNEPDTGTAGDVTDPAEEKSVDAEVSTGGTDGPTETDAPSEAEAETAVADAEAAVETAAASDAESTSDDANPS